MSSTVLAVDDDPAICRLIQRLLTSHGYTVATAADGHTALWSVFARARRLSPTLPIIVISGVDTGVWQSEKSLAAQAVFLRKPFDLDHLLAIVARLLAGTPPELDTKPGQIDDEDAEGR